MPEDAGRTAACPWCSEPLPAAGATECPSCGAHLVAETTEDVPGVTAIDPALARLAAAPRKVKRTFGSLLVGDDDEIPPPTDAEMPALARPDEDVRLEMLRLELEARLAEQRADARMLHADGRAAAPPPVEAGQPDEAPGEVPPPATDSVAPTEPAAPATEPEPALEAPASGSPDERAAP